MRIEEKLKALAELDGWKDISGDFPYQGLSPHAQSRNADYRLPLPSYLYSYDAILPLVQK